VWFIYRLIMSDCDKQSLRKTCVHVFVDNMQLLSILERQQFWILSLRACSKHAVQPICAVQDEICAVQNEKLCSPKTQSWRHHCAVFQEYIDNYLSIYLSIYLSKKSRLGRRKCRNTTRAPQKFSAGLLLSHSTHQLLWLLLLIEIYLH